MEFDVQEFAPTGSVHERSSNFSRKLAEMGVLRMQQVVLVPVGHSCVAAEILVDIAPPTPKLSTLH
jgi:hypothetical protein